MFLVIGGYTGSVRLDSTEIFDPDVGSWRAGAALSNPVTQTRAVTFGNRIFIFGIDITFHFKRELSIIINVQKRTTPK